MLSTTAFSQQPEGAEVGGLLESLQTKHSTAHSLVLAWRGLPPGPSRAVLSLDLWLTLPRWAGAMGKAPGHEVQMWERTPWTGSSGWRRRLRAIRCPQHFDRVTLRHSQALCRGRGILAPSVWCPPWLIKHTITFNFKT